MGPVNELDAWVAAASRELGLKPGDVQPTVVLDVARDVARQVLRPAAPLTAYLMGVAVGRGADPADAAARIRALAQAWPTREGTEPTRPSTEPTRPSTEPTRPSTEPTRPSGEPTRPSGAPGGEGREPGRERGKTVADPPAQ
jgi:hypothetical protein